MNILNTFTVDLREIITPLKVTLRSRGTLDKLSHPHHHLLRLASVNRNTQAPQRTRHPLVSRLSTGEQVFHAAHQDTEGDVI